MNFIKKSKNEVENHHFKALEHKNRLKIGEFKNAKK